MSDFVLVEDNGAEVAFRTEGDGPPMLLHNGLVSTEFHWRFWVPHYRARFKVALWDYPGHGQSLALARHPPDLSSINIPAFADQGHAVARAAFNGAPSIVCGLSMGVQTALEHYRRHPSDVRALVLLCGAYGHPLDRVSRSPLLRKGVAAALRALGRNAPLMDAIAWPALHTPLGREFAFLSGGADRKSCPPGLLDELFHHVATMRAGVITEAMASYVEHDAAEVLDRIEVPTLIIAGDRDQLTPVSLAERMHQRIRGSSLHIVHGHSHLALLEVPDEVHSVVDRFLGTHHLDLPRSPRSAPSQYVN